MSIPIACPACGHAGYVPDGFAGQTIRCPKCRRKFPAIQADKATSVMPPDTDATQAMDLSEFLLPNPPSVIPAPANYPVAKPVAPAHNVLPASQPSSTAASDRMTVARLLNYRVYGVAAAVAGLFVVVVFTFLLVRGRQTDSANREAAALVATARQQISLGNLGDAEALLQRAVTIPRMKDDGGAANLLAEVREAQAARLLQAAEDAIGRKDFKEALGLLKKHLAHVRPADRARGMKLLAEMELALSPERALAALEAMTDEQFAAWKKNGELPVGLRSNSPVLAQTWADLLLSQETEATKRREVARLARVAEEHRREDAERIARLEQERRAQTEKTAREQQKGIGVPREALRSLFEKPEIGFTFNRGSPSDGQENYIGTKRTAIVQLIGPANNLTYASITVSVPNDNKAEVLLNSVYLLGFLKHAIPGWSESQQWLKDAIPEATRSDRARTTSGNVLVELVFFKELGLMVLTVKARE